MHIRLLYKKVLYVFLSLVIVIFPTIEQANAASSWGISSAVSAGARTIVTATKSGYKSAVNISPTAGRLGLRLIKGANYAAIGYAMIQLAGEKIDWVLDPENNAVKYKYKPGHPLSGFYDVNNCSLSGDCVAGSTPEIACKNYTKGKKYLVSEGGSCLTYSDYWGEYTSPLPINFHPDDKWKSVSIVTVASNVIKNANGGHADSQAATRETATEMVIGGQFDHDLLSGAVPQSDNTPLIPAVPGNGNGNVTHGSDVGDGMSGATPGQQSDDAKAAADAAAKAAAAAKDAAKAAADAAREASDKAQDLINSGADAAERAAADAAAKAAVQSAKDAAASAAAAAERASSRADAAERAATAATAAAKAAAEKAAADLAAAIAAGEQAAIDAAKAAEKSAAKELVEAKEKQAAAEKAAEKAKAEAAKPFELPAFCTWAAVVCDYTAWVKQEYAKAKDWVKEEPVSNPAELMPIEDDPAGLGDIFKDKADASYVSFERSCPADVLIPIDLMGASQVLNISYAPFCHFASMIRYAVILGAWISGLLIVTGGRSRE